MQRRGFTLLEISIVLSIIAVILGGGLVITGAYIQKRQLDTTVARMDAIEDALLKFSVAYNRIPCPGDMKITSTSVNYGMEAGAGVGSPVPAATGVCTWSGAYSSVMLPAADFIATNGVSEGSVPTRALQLPDSYMFDGWGRHFRYAVDPTQTVSNALPAPTGSFSCPVPSGITVNDASGTARTTKAAYTLTSSGANGHGGYTNDGAVHNTGSTNADELTNCHCTSAGVASTYTSAYVQKASTIDPADQLDIFDDIVAYKEPWQLQTPNNPLTIPVNSCFYLAVGETTSPYLTMFSFKNNLLTPQPVSSEIQIGAPNSGPYNAGLGADFSPDNTLFGWVNSTYTYSDYLEGWLFNVSGMGLSYPYIFYDPTKTNNAHLMSDVKFSPSGNYIVAGGTKPYMQVNYKSGGVWTSTATISPTPTVALWNFAWHPDQHTLYAAEYAGQNTGTGGTADQYYGPTGSAPITGAQHYIDVYSYSDPPPSTFTLLSAKQIDTRASYGGGSSTGLYGGPLGMAVHPTGSYLAYGVYGAASNSGNYYHPVVLSGIPTATTTGTITQLTNGLRNYGSSEISNSVAWSPDGGYLAVALTTYAQGFDVYAFTPASSPVFTASTISGGGCAPGASVSFSKDGNYLAVGSTGSAPLCIYSRSGNTFTKLTLNYTLPTGRVNAVVWSK